MTTASQPPSPSRLPRVSQLRALRDLGLDKAQRRTFLSGEATVYYFPTESAPAIAVLHWTEDCVRSGIIAIQDVGGGLTDLSRFRSKSFAVARAVGASSLELFGGALINKRLEALLLRQGFTRRMDSIPSVLGGGTMEIMTKVLAVK